MQPAISAAGASFPLVGFIFKSACIPVGGERNMLNNNMRELYFLPTILQRQAYR